MVFTVWKHDQNEQGPPHLVPQSAKVYPSWDSELRTSSVVQGACSANRSMIGSALR